MNASERTQYGYKNHEGHRLHIMADRILTGNVLVRVTGVGDLEPRSMDVRDEDVPGVALAMLRAAGFAPSGNPEPYGFRACVETAAGHLDDAVLIAAGKAAKAELIKRRDDLAAKLFDLPVYELHPDPFTYFDSTEVVRNAIDMIIQLQDEAAK